MNIVEILPNKLIQISSSNKTGKTLRLTSFSLFVIWMSECFFLALFYP